MLHVPKIQRGQQKPRDGKSNKDQITRPRITIIPNPDASIKAQPITARKTQDNMSSLESRNPTTTGPKYSNTAEAQDKDFKTAIMNIIKDLKEDTHLLIKSMKTQTVE